MEMAATALVAAALEAGDGGEDEEDGEGADGIESNSSSGDEEGTFFFNNISFERTSYFSVASFRPGSRLTSVV